MAFRRPLYMDIQSYPGDPVVAYQFFEIPDAALDVIHEFAPYAYGNNSSGPSAKLEVNTANGTQMPDQPFVDTYYIAGTYTTRVDRFSTEAETPNISMVTDNYSRIRIVYDSVSLPTGDTNNLQYPLYLYSTGPADTDIHLRAMSRQDFIDTFVIPALDAMTIWDATTNNAQQGTYFLTTSASPANATLVSATPVAVNSVADIAAYTSGGIPETQKQTVNTNYYLARVNYAATTYGVYSTDLSNYDLPLYFDAASESIKQHTPTTWANLLGPFLRYYLATPGTGYKIEYNLSSGNQRGTTYTDTRVTPTGTGYTTRYVNTNDYRTQEFPTGTASTITANTKRFYISREGAVGLSGTTSSPIIVLGDTPVWNGISNWVVDNGFTFHSDGNIYEYSYTYPGTTNVVSTTQWFNGTPSSTYYIRVVQEVIPYNFTQTPPNQGDTLGVWHSLATSRTFRYRLEATYGSYGTRLINIKVEIATDAAGTNIIATGYYQNTWEGGA